MEREEEGRAGENPRRQEVMEISSDIRWARRAIDLLLASSGWLGFVK